MERSAIVLATPVATSIADAVHMCIVLQHFTYVLLLCCLSDESVDTRNRRG